MKILTVCRHNQARSLIIAAMLRRFCPEVETFSAGTHALHGSPIPLNIRRIADLWELKLEETHSSNLGHRDDLHTFDAFFCADEMVANDVVGFGVNKEAVYNIQDFAQIQKLIPTDPINMDYEATKSELMKIAISTSRLLQKMRLVPSMQIVAVTFDGSREKLSQLLSLIDQGTHNIIFDASIRIPSSDFWNNWGKKVVSIDLFKQDTFIEDRTSPADLLVVMSKYEVDNPESFFLSKKWFELLSTLHEKRNVYVAISELHNSGHEDLSGYVWSESVISLRGSR